MRWSRTPVVLRLRRVPESADVSRPLYLCRVSTALFPHHHWADADGLEEPDPLIAKSGYFRRDPDAYSARLRGWHQLLWSKQVPGGPGLELRPEPGGLRDLLHDEFLSSDAAVPVWERWGEVKSFHAAAESKLREQGRGSIHDLGWRLYDMGGFLLFPGYQVNRAWSINQAKGCTRARIADRLDLTLECIRLYYALLDAAGGRPFALPDGYDRVNPLGSVLHRYRPFFETFSTFAGYVDFWLLDDLVAKDDEVRFLLPRQTDGPYDFTREYALPLDAAAYRDYLIAADDFVARRNHRMAKAAAALGHDVCPECLSPTGSPHARLVP